MKRLQTSKPATSTAATSIVAALLTIGLGCSVSRSESPSSSTTTSPLPEAVYRCSDGYQFSIADVQQEILLWTADADRARRLEEVASSSGARFSGDEWVFWGYGSETLLENGSVVHAGCERQPLELVWERARVRGVEFRALGNEPGWLVEISPTGTRIELDYARETYDLPPPESLAGASDERLLGYRTRSDEHRFELRATREECSDTMSDQVYPWVVEVTVDERVFSGCGRRLQQR